jgi:hypothetical protein
MTVLAYLAAVWTAFGAGVCLSLLAWSRLCNWALVLVLTVLLVLQLHSLFAPRHVAIDALIFALAVGSCASLPGTAWAYFEAARQGHISPRAPWGALALWITAVACMFSAPGCRVNLLDETLVTLGGLALPLTPFALAPLAVAWNRHRGPGSRGIDSLMLPVAKGATKIETKA